MTAAKHQVFDCDIHVIEPPDMWERYADIHKELMPRGSRLAYEGVVPFVRYEDNALPDLIDREKLGLSVDVYEQMIFASPQVRLVTEKARRRFARFFELGWSGRAVLEGMDAEGVDLTVLFPTSGLLALATDKLDPKTGHAVSRAYNNYLSELCQADRARLYGAAMISLHDVELALAETRRAVLELGFKGIFLRPNLVHGRNWYDEAYTPLWHLLEELDVPVIFHEGIGGQQPHAGKNFGANVFLHHVACHPLEMMLATISFCGGGVLAKHPKLRVGFFEASCGWLPFLLDRLDDHYEHEVGVVAAQLPEPPSEYFKRQCFISCEADERLTATVASFVGEDQLLFSTDFPHPDSKFPESIAKFRQASGLTPAQIKRVLWDNPLRLYGMHEPAIP